MNAKKCFILGIILLVIGTALIVGMSIWQGFPQIAGFNKTPILGVGYGVGAICVIAGFALSIEYIGNRD